MDRLNTQRMKQYALWQLTSNRSLLLKITGVLASSFTALFLFTLFVTKDSILAQEKMLILPCSMSLVFCGSWAFNGLNTKQIRTMQLMLPASSAEKFIVRYGIVLLSSLIMPLIAFLAADLVQWVCSLIAQQPEATLLTPRAIAYGVSLLGDTNYFSIEGFLASVLLFFVLHSFYLLCGIFFKKHSWLFGTITLNVLIGIVTFAFFVLGHLLMTYILDDGGYWIELLPWAEDATKCAVCAITVAIVVLNYWLAYRIFRRLQVINNRFFNW